MVAKAESEWVASCEQKKVTDNQEKEEHSDCSEEDQESQEALSDDKIADVLKATCKGEICTNVCLVQ